MQSKVVAIAALGLTACLGPNPRLELQAGDSESGAGSEESDTGDAHSESESEASGDGDGDGEGDGDGDSGCSNGVLDGDETDLDCGGSCQPCAPGSPCEGPEDCDSSVCEARVCAAPSCSDDIKNGDELEADCGGSCRFCEHSVYVDEFDDFEGSDSLAPNVAIFADGSFALIYPSLQSGEFRLRWFDELAQPLGPGELVSPEITQTSLAWQSLIPAGGLDAHEVYAVLNGQDPISTNKDVFAVARGPQTPASHTAIYQGQSAVSWADMVVDGDIATFVWDQGGEIRLRRYNLASGNALATPTTANPEFETRPGKHPIIARRGGVSVVAWVACELLDPSSCELELRRFDPGWLDPGPVPLGLEPHPYQVPQIAIAEDARVALTWSRSGESKQIWAAILDAELELLDSPWVLQDDAVTPLAPSSDVAALADGSFAFAWPDGGDARVHLRRFTAPEIPLVTDIGDEAPWPLTDDPYWVRVASAGNRLIVVWSGRLDGLYQIQGQVLSY